MLYYVSGIVTVLEPGLAVIDCGGVGYALNTSAYTISALRRGEKAKAAGILVYRTDVRQSRSDDGPAKVEQKSTASGDDQKVERIAFYFIHGISLSLSL